MNSARKPNNELQSSQNLGSKNDETKIFDLDEYLNLFIPSPRLDVLPSTFSYVLGYRSPNQILNHNKAPKLLLFYAGCFVGTFAGIAMIEGVYRSLSYLGGQQVPIVIGSFGAAAILEYNAVSSPFSQPRNLILGHITSAFIGVSFTKIFLLLPHSQFEDLRWLPGALAVGVASVFMHFTKTVHPPAGATALLAATSPEITLLGWWLLPLILIGCLLMLASACLVNNLISPPFPLYWWTSVDLAALRRQKKSKINHPNTGIEETATASTKTSDRSASDTLALGQDERKAEDNFSDLTFATTRLQPEITITADRISFTVPITLSEWEESFLVHLQGRLISPANAAPTEVVSEPRKEAEESAKYRS